MHTPRINRRLTTAIAVAVALTTSFAPASIVNASTRSKGQMFVFDSPDCTGAGNSPKVTVPASVGGRDYPPNIDMDIYATDTATGERFGPYVAHTNGNGDFCERVVTARATKWKIDLVEPGSGFTDSKVVTVLSSPPPATTTTAPATTTPTTIAPTTTAATTTTLAGTTTSGVTTTAAVTTTTAATTTTGVATTTTLVGSSGPPIELVPAPVPPEWSLPATGSATTDQATWALLFLALGGALVATVRRRGGATNT